MSPVIGTILMVAITVVLAAVLYVMVASIGPVTSMQRPTLVMTPGIWGSGNLTISFSSMTNAANLNPADLLYLVQAPNGTTYFTGAAGTGPSTGGVRVTVLYQDLGTPLRVSPEDQIRLSVSPANSTAIRGGLFRVFQAGEIVGSLGQLP